MDTKKNDATPVAQEVSTDTSQDEAQIPKLEEVPVIRTPDPDTEKWRWD